MRAQYKIKLDVDTYQKVIGVKCDHNGYHYYQSRKTRVLDTFKRIQKSLQQQFGKAAVQYDIDEKDFTTLTVE